MFHLRLSYLIFHISLGLLTAMLSIPTYASGNCREVFSEIEAETAAFFESTKAVSQGDASLKQLLELAALLNQEVHNVGFQNGNSDLHRGVGEVAESGPALMYFNHTFTEVPKEPSLETTELRKLVDRVEIPEAISRVLKFIAYELAGVKPDGNGAPRLLQSTVNKRNFIERTILPPLNGIFKKIPLNWDRGDRMLVLSVRLTEVLLRAHEGDSYYNKAREKYGIDSGMGVYEEIYDRVAREMINDFPELPEKIRKALLKLTINPETELIAKAAVSAQVHPQSVFMEEWNPPTSDTFTEEEIHSGRARGVFIQKSAFILGSKAAIPVTLLKILPDSNSWLVASTAQLSSKFRDRVDIYRVPLTELSVSNFPGGAAQTQFELSEKEPNFKFKHTSILIDSRTDRGNKDARLSFVLESLGVAMLALVEKPSEPSEPILVSRYPDSRTLESAESVLKASIAREFLLTKGGRELRATTADLKALEIFFTLNGSETPTDGASPIELAQIESIKQSIVEFRKLIETLDSNIKKIKDEYGISDIQGLIKNADTKEKRHKLFEQLAIELLEIEETLKNSSEASKEKLVLGAVHAELEVELFKFAGPKNKAKAEKWLVDKRTEMKNLLLYFEFF